MKIYEYSSLKEYESIQTKYNHQKINYIWISYKTAKTVSVKAGPDIKSILCHGTRNATEQLFFKRLYPNAFIWGSEISDNAADFPMTTRWNFMKEKKDWLGRFDMVYSNSFDHTIKPTLTIQRWLDQLKPDGKLFIEISFDIVANVARESDPLELSNDEFRKLVTKAGGVVIEKFKTYPSFRKVSERWKEKKWTESQTYLIKKNV